MTTGTNGWPTSVYFSAHELRVIVVLSAIAFLIDPTSARSTPRRRWRRRRHTGSRWRGGTARHHRSARGAAGVRERAVPPRARRQAAAAVAVEVRPARDILPRRAGRTTADQTPLVMR